MGHADSSGHDGCIFCKIIAGEIPCAKVYEDEQTFAFLDLNPVAKGHTLVVPKKHCPTLLDVPPGMGEALIRALQLVAGAVQKETDSSGFNCIQNNFSAAGQVVFHSHWHVIPRSDGDGLEAWPGSSYGSSDEMQQLAVSVSARITDGSSGG